MKFIQKTSKGAAQFTVLEAQCGRHKSRKIQCPHSGVECGDRSTIKRFIMNYYIYNMIIVIIILDSNIIRAYR